MFEIFGLLCKQDQEIILKLNIESVNRKLDSSQYRIFNCVSSNERRVLLLFFDEDILMDFLFVPPELVNNIILSFIQRFILFNLN